MKILFISYDGIFDPLGQSQVLPYLKGLAEKGAFIHLISFEKRNYIKNETLFSFRKELSVKEGIDWHPLIYHRRPIIPATLYDIFTGFFKGWLLIKKEKISIIHARGYIAGLIAWFIKISNNVKFIFDMRGFWPEEKVDAGAWPKDGLLYRFIKYLEKKIIFCADKIIVLTQAAKDLLVSKYRLSNISVIPCCVDLEVFSRDSKPHFNLSLSENRLLITYVGSVGTFYNFEETARFFKILKSKLPQAYFLILSNGNRGFILKTLNNFNIGSDDYFVSSVSYEQVPLYLSRSAISLIFYRRVLSASGCCPNKFAESLACGVPVVISAGIGDCDHIVRKEGVGVVLKGESLESYAHIIEEVEDILDKKEDIANRCRYVAKKYFSLEDGIEKYFSIYQRLTVKN